MKQKQKPFYWPLSILLSFELIASPLIPSYAMAEEHIPKEDKKPEESNFNKVMEGTSAVLKAAGDAYNSVMSAQNLNSPNPALANDLRALQQQMTPIPDKYFNAQKLMQIPGLGNYLALNGINPAALNCTTLPTTLTEARGNSCEYGVNPSAGLPQQQIGEMLTYSQKYSEVSKLYKNYSIDSNTDGQAFGVGCMNNAMMILNGFFKYRIDELDKLVTNFEAMQDQFKKASRADLDAIEEAVAVLEGNSEMASKVRSKKPDLFNFGKRFNNPACNSMFPTEGLNTIGREGGLNKINSDIKGLLTNKKGKYSGESYSKSHNGVIEDINSLANKVSKQYELNFPILSQNPSNYNSFLTNVPNLVSSPNGMNKALSRDVFSDVQTKFNEKYLKLNEQKLTVLDELSNNGVDGKIATNLLGNTTSKNFDSEVSTIEKQLKNKCLENTLSDINRDNIMKKMYDPNASSHANKFASNFIKDKLNRILDDKNSSLEKKMAELQSLENQNGGRYYIKMENRYEVQTLDSQGNPVTKVMDATPRTPSSFFIDIVQNCQAQFKSNKLNNKLTGSAAIQKLRDLNSQFKSLAKEQALDIKNEIRKKMIECTSPEIANNTVAGSCTPDLFDTSSPGFCANAALSCSKNMQACSKQAETYTNQIKNERTARVNNYKALVEKNKLDVIKIFDSALSRYMQEGEMMRGMFGAGFSSPAGISREVPEGNKYLNEFKAATGKSIDGQLLLEDPEKFIGMFKGNINKLKASVKKQQDQILGGESVGQSRGLLAQHIEKTKANYKTVVSEADKISGQCKKSYTAALQQSGKQQEEYAKKMSELGEKRDEFCNLYGMARTNPQAVCGEVQGELIKDSLKGVGTLSPNEQAKAREEIYNLSKYCNQYGNHSESSSNNPDEAWSICENSPPDKIKGRCDRLKVLSNECDIVVKGNENTPSTTMDQCISLQEQIVSIYYGNSRRSTSGEVEPLSAPTSSYCASGVSSIRTEENGFSKGLNTFSNEFKKAMATGVTR